MAFLTARRLRAYPRLIVTGYLVTAIIATVFWFANPWSRIGHPGGDFLVFYAAGQMANAGRMAAAYDMAQIHAVYTAIIPSALDGLGWFYPPPFLWVVQPFALLPYCPALVLWVGVTATLFALALRPLVRNRDEAWAIAASAPVFYNIFNGQNGFLTAALVIWCFRLLPVRPVAAGIALGCLCYKPHLGLLFPFLLAGLRQWRAFLAAAATVAGIVLASLQVQGIGVWRVFLAENAARMNGLAENFTDGRISSPYALMLNLGAGAGAARLVQLTFVLLTIAGILALVRRRVPYRFVFAFTVAAMLPAAPHNMVYDWPVLALPMLLLWREIEARGPLSFEPGVMIAVALLPAALVILSTASSLAPGVLLLLALMALVARRGLRAAGREDGRGLSPAAGLRPG